MSQNQTNNSFKFFENFLYAIDRLPKEKRAKACYEFCKFGITGELPKDENLAMFCVGVSASVQKYQGRGGKREGSGRKPSKIKHLEENQKNQKNQNNQKNHNEQTETETETETKYKFKGNIIRLVEKDYNSWKGKYPNIDLDFELECIDNWFMKSENEKKRKDWFWSTASMLARKNNEIKLKKEQKERSVFNGRS